MNNLPVATKGVHLIKDATNFSKLIQNFRKQAWALYFRPVSQKKVSRPLKDILLTEKQARAAH